MVGRFLSVFFVVAMCLASGVMIGGCERIRCEVKYEACRLDCGDSSLCKTGCKIDRRLCNW